MTVELLSADQVAERLQVAKSRLSRGWGPPPLPQYRRPRRWSRRVVEDWLAAQEVQCQSESAASAPPQTGVSTHGTPDSRPAAGRSGGQLAQQVADELRSKSRDSKPSLGPRHLVPVPEDA